jgi:hypothetical protein
VDKGGGGVDEGGGGGLWDEAGVVGRSRLSYGKGDCGDQAGGVPSRLLASSTVICFMRRRKVQIVEVSAKVEQPLPLRSTFASSCANHDNNQPNPT